MLARMLRQYIIRKFLGYGERLNHFTAPQAYVNQLLLVVLVNRGSIDFVNKNKRGRAESGAADRSQLSPPFKGRCLGTLSGSCSAPHLKLPQAAPHYEATRAASRSRQPAVP